MQKIAFGFFVVATMILGASSSYAGFVACDAAKGAPAVAFLLDEDGKIVWPGFGPHVFVTDQEKAGLRVCIPLPQGPDPAKLKGVVNVRLQFYTALEKPSSPLKDRTEYENKAYRAKLNKWLTRAAAVHSATPRELSDTYPSVAIAAYQNYHGCSGNQFALLHDDFHMNTPAGRTDAPERRARFLFSRDVPPACNVVTAGMAFFGGFLPRGILFASGNLDSFVPRPDLIDRRRSVVLSFNNAKQKHAFLTYDVRNVKRGNCLRVEVSQIFDDSAPAATLGLACIGARAK